MAVLMGANTRTYKFALGHALLEIAGQGRDVVTLEELSAPYALAIADRSFPQAPVRQADGEADYLTVLDQEREESLANGWPTERLLDATVRSIPGMVMQKFHNLRGAKGVPHRFYEISERGRRAQVILTPDLIRVSQGPHQDLIWHELGSRWNLVETAFDAGIGRSLISHGVLTSSDSLDLLDYVRRAPVAQTRSSLIGFQHGRCFLCGDPILELDTDVHVDHTFPYSLMTTGAWRGPDLNGVWNLTVVHAGCNLRKGAAIPDGALLFRLAQRNEDIVASPHPLRRSITLAAGSTEAHRRRFYQSVADLATFAV